MNLNRLAYFAAVVDAGSFTQAAVRLGVTKAVVSHQVAQLEQDLRTTLLIRTTRRVQPTEAGAAFHIRCTQILREAEDAYAEVTAEHETPSGTLRITAPFDYGIASVVPVVTAFTARYPACNVELVLGDRTLDLIEGQIDLALRVGWLDDSSLQARKIGSFRQYLVGSARLADQIAAIREPADLPAVPFIANAALRKPRAWQFTHDDHPPQDVFLPARIVIDTTLGVLSAVRAGGGLSVLPEFLVTPLLANGELLYVLPDWRLRSGGIHTVFPAARFRPAKVTAFVDMLVKSEHKVALHEIF
ncbi:LysR family transcriptional regulator [Paracoccus suum]|uniref:LysR family transcriptional regulator n=1 Tax=Paracoccus suum TaxID=2259340 RepID=A0A344PM67_9RHOB|nr:LysR family transcriptional regulator [Paracoccus suum]AXC50472.1 LysR family transcriptional regulator [Paracoccus suum]